MLVWEDDSRTHNTTARVVHNPDATVTVRPVAEALSPSSAAAASSVSFQSAEPHRPQSAAFAAPAVMPLQELAAAVPTTA
ncbi:MAG: hypothetical protein EBS47_12540, partial [Betaproteobacteria bacterium]|nr:hypothetical protein [Betaproteobacteria bacterium]